MSRRKPLVREVNPHLICVLCSGYFIEATTIVECLHSFCRSCLIKYLEKNKFCPICDVQLHKNNPLLSVRCDPTLQQLVYKLIPGLYAKEMTRRRKYYSELGGGPASSDSDSAEYPVPDVYFAPTDCISLSLEFLPGGAKADSGSDYEDPIEKQGVHHRRYLQCPAAVNVSHLKKFLRMKYDLSPTYDVEILHSGEVLSDEYSLMDVAYIFSWNKVTPLRFQFRLLQRRNVPKLLNRVKCENGMKTPTIPTAKADIKKLPDSPVTKGAYDFDDDEDEDAKDDDFKTTGGYRLESKEANGRTDEEENSNYAMEENDEEDDEPKLEVDDTLERLEEEEEAMERLEEDELNQRIEEEALLEEEAIEEVEEEEDIPAPPKEIAKITERPNGMKRPMTIDIPKQEPEPKKQKLSPPPKLDVLHFKQDEKRFLEDMIVEEDTDEDRLRISASEEEKSPGPNSEIERVREEKPREERRKKKSKKGKHHHHRHRHHDRDRSVSPPTAQIVHSPENDVLKLKVKLTAIKTGDNTVKGYTVSEGIDTRKEYKDHKENGHKHSEKSVEKTEKVKPKEEEFKKSPSPVTYSIRNNNNNNTINSNNNISNSQNVTNTNNTNFCNTAFAEFARKTDEINKEKFQQQHQQQQLKAIKKILPKINGTIKTEPVKMPPSSITVSKITAEEKRQMEQQKLLMNRNHSNGMDNKRPSLEIMLVNAPKKSEASPSPEKSEVKKVIRPTPPSIPLSKLGKGGLMKGSPPPLRSVRPDEALDLSGKSSRKSPEAPPPVVSSSPLPDSLLKVVKPYVAAPARPCKPNPTVRQIPNPSALLFRSHGRPPFPPPALPISSLRQMETMTKKIEKVAAGLTVKATAAGYGVK